MTPAKAWTIVGLFTLAYWGTSTDPQYPILLPNFLSGHYEIGTGAASLPIVFASLGAIIGTLVSGLLARRHGIGLLIFINLWAFVALSFVNAVEGPFSIICLTRFFTGLFQGGLSLLFLLGVGVLVPPERRGVGVGVLTSGAMLAALAIPLLVIATKEPESAMWRMPFAVFGVAALIGVLGLHGVRMPLRPGHESEESHVARLLRSRRMVALLALGGLLLTSIVAMGSTFPIFMDRRFDKDLPDCIWQVVTLGVGAVVGALISGKATDRFGPRIILIWTSIVVTPIFAVVPLLATSPVAVYPVFFVMSATAAARVPPYQALMLRVIPERARGPVLGIRNTISYAGTALGAGAGAWLFEVFDSYLAVALFAAVMSAVTLTVIWRHVPRRIELHMMG